MLPSLAASPLVALLLLGVPSTGASVRQDDTIRRSLYPGQYMGLSFDLVDIDGKPAVLMPLPRKDAPADAPKPPVTVIMFFSLYDPASAVAVERLSELRSQYRQDRIEFVLVDSNDDELTGGGDPLEKFRRWRDEKKVEIPLLIDRGNVAADRFGALCSTQMFVIDPGRVVRYTGAIDDDPQGRKRAAGQPVESYLDKALTAILSGSLPEVNTVRPYAGRPIKRAPVPEVPK